MSEQDVTQSSTKQRRSRKTSTDNQQNGQQAPATQRPSNEDTKAWKAYWKEQSQPWRTEPEIDTERQKYLKERRAVKPDIEQGIYPFKDIKLSRADIEWLLATHEEKTWQTGTNFTIRAGIDLRGADLCRIDLHGLPLSGLHAGLDREEWPKATEDQREAAAIHLEEANLTLADLSQSQLKGAHLEGANLSKTHFEFASLRGAHLGGKTITEHCTRISAAHLQYTYFNAGTTLEETDLGNKQDGYIRLVDVRWGGINLATVNWSQVKMLGNEQEAHQRKTPSGRKKDKITLLKEYEVAMRANRQLANALREQGLNEDAARFTYRAQLMQRKVFWYQHKYGRWFFSLLLALLSGYGYRIWRILAAYVVVVSLFALVYFVLGLHYPPHLHFDQAYLESITAFHGRVFSEQFYPNTPQIWITAIEAIAGLIIEGVFIAMLIQRFFEK